MIRNEHLKPRTEPISVGEAAPDFTLLDQDRREVRLSDLLKERGRVVLSFYPMDFTSVCTGEMECFTADKPRFEKVGAALVGVSCDSFATHKAFAEQSKLELTLLADMHREVCKAYGLYWADLNVASRGTVVIGSDGAVKWVSAREPGDQIKNADLLSHVG